MRTNLSNNILYVEIDSLGAQLVSLKDIHGIEYLWQGDKKYWKGQAPLLFPIVGALRNDTAIIDGEKYTIPRHGIARTNEFRRTKSMTDSASFTLSSDFEIRKNYPFDFTLAVDFELADSTLIQRFTITNRDAKDMPFSLGCHPAFNIPLEENDKFEDYIISFPNDEDCDSPTIDPQTSLILTKERMTVLKNARSLPLRHELFYKDALVLENLKSRQVSLFSLSTGRGVQMDFNGFDYFGIWQSKNAPFLCLEPWTSTATCDFEDDVLSHKRGMLILSPGESKQFIMKITLL